MQVAARRLYQLQHRETGENRWLRLMPAQLEDYKRSGWEVAWPSTLRYDVPEAVNHGEA